MVGVGLYAVGLFPSGEQARASSSQGPVAAYSFDEGTGTTAEDITGDGHTATIEGATWARGKYGDGLEFDASNEAVVKVPDSPELDLTEEFTLEAWVRPNELTHYYDPIIAKELGGGKPEGSYKYGYWLYAGWGYQEAFGGTETASGAEGTVAGEPLAKNTWSHVAMTYDGAKLRLYVDGELVDTETAPAPQVTAGELEIGGDSEHGDYLNGKIDEVRIYNRALNAGEVGADMAASLQTPQQGPVAAYSFDEGTGTTAEDITGDGHTATIEGATWARGKYGDGLEFDGVNDKVTIPDSQELDFSEEFTLEAWVKTGEYPEWGPIISKEDSSAPPAYLLSAQSYGTPHAFVYDASGYEKHVGAPEALDQNAWNHVAATYDGAKLRLYVNGELVNTATGLDPKNGAGPLEIGTDAFAGFFHGKIDEVRIYNRALNAGEVGADMAAPLQTPQQGPVAAYSFDEGEGTTAEDITGDGHTATIEGAEWTNGKYGDALKFNGASSCVSIADTTDLRLGEEFTLESWVKAEGELKKDPIVFKEGSSYLNYALDIGHATTGRGEGSIGVTASPNHTDAASTASLEANVWTNLATTYDGAKLRLYVNGDLVATKAVTGANSGREGALKIGCDSQYSEHFHGKIDEVRVYNRALSAGELEPNQGPDTTPPTIALSGALTEGLKSGTAEYPLHVHVTDGTLEKRGAGVKGLTILVDSATADSVSQKCPQTNCSLDREWTFNTEVYGYSPHTVTVEAEDLAGNTAESSLPLPVANGSLPACSSAGPQPASPPDETEALAGGGSTAIYHGSEGVELRFPSAPAEFNPRSATDSELDLYGFPPRPSTSESRAREVWNQTVGQETSDSAPGGCMMVASPQRAQVGATHLTIHSAYFASNPSGPLNQWRGAQTEYAQPGLTNTCSDSAVTSTWVAVGGSGEGFFQAGTTEPYGYYNGEEKRLFNASAFMEFILATHPAKLRLNEEPLHLNLEISRRDRIFSEVIWKPVGEFMYFYVLDRTTGRSLHIEVNSPHPESDVFRGRQLEFAGAERASNGELADFGGVNLIGNEGLVSGEGWTSLAELGHLINGYMTEENEKGEPIGQPLAANSELTNVKGRGAAFRTEWLHCHPAKPH